MIKARIGRDVNAKLLSTFEGLTALPLILRAYKRGNKGYARIVTEMHNLALSKQQMKLSNLESV